MNYDCIHLSEKQCSAKLHAGTISIGICAACQWRNKSLAEISKKPKTFRVGFRKKGCATCKPIVVEYIDEGLVEFKSTKKPTGAIKD